MSEFQKLIKQRDLLIETAERLFCVANSLELKMRQNNIRIYQEQADAINQAAVDIDRVREEMRS